MHKLLLRTFVIASSLLFLIAIASAQTTLTIQPTLSTSIGSAQSGNAVGGPEIDPAFDSGDDNSPSGNGAITINRTIGNGSGAPVGVSAGPKFKSNPTLVNTFNGLNLFDQRFANNGNQFTVEPPDQGLCVGNGFVIESVNDVIKVFDTAGNALTGAVDLNTFYGYPAAINRHTNPLQFGPEVTDPSCYFDAQTQRFYHVVLTLDRVGTTSGLTGRNHLDVAVSNSSNPLGSWTIYRIDVTNDGANGTPNHHCVGGPCLGDYPHVGADAFGFYITTNEFAFVDGFRGSQIYAISKRALAAGGAVSVVLFDTTAFPDADGLPGFTVWPAQSAAGQYDTDNGGTEFLLSSDAVFFASRSDNRLRQWTLTNTSSLDSATPSLSLTNSFISTIGYAVPPKSKQKVGDYPQGQTFSPPQPEPERLDSNDSRIQQVFYANGRLWTALDSGVTFDGVHALAGIAFFVINPNSGKATAQGYIAVPNNNVTYPAVAATADGRGAVAFTLTGPDFFPSAAYASLDAVAGAGDVQMASAGVGAWDGFTAYPGGGGRSRWGDYGAAATDGNNIWIASEYIPQTCNVAQYLADKTCGGTRAPLGNWGTRISELQMK